MPIVNNTNFVRRGDFMLCVLFFTILILKNMTGSNVWFGEVSATGSGGGRSHKQWDEIRRGFLEEVVVAELT